MAVQLITNKKIKKFDLNDPNFKPPPQPEPEEVNGNIVVEEDEEKYVLSSISKRYSFEMKKTNDQNWEVIK